MAKPHELAIIKSDNYLRLDDTNFSISFHCLPFLSFLCFISPMFLYDVTNYDLHQIIKAFYYFYLDVLDQTSFMGQKNFDESEHGGSSPPHSYMHLFIHSLPPKFQIHTPYTRNARS